MWACAHHFRYLLISRKCRTSTSSCLQAVVTCCCRRLNFSTAWSTNTVSICQSAGLTNVTRVELSRRFLIKVCTEREREIIFWSDWFRIGFHFMFVSFSPPAKEWREREGAQWRYKEADWVSVWQHDRVHLSTSHHLLHCGRQTTARVWSGHPREGPCSLGDCKWWSWWDALNILVALFSFGLLLHLFTLVAQPLIALNGL